MAIATGRAHYKAVHFTDAIGINDLVCSGGGGIVVDGKLIYNEPLNHKQITSILRHADEEGVGYLLMLDDSERVYMKDYRFLEQVGLRKELTTYIYEPTLDINQIDILKVYLAIPKGDDDKYPWMKEMPYLRFVGNYVMYQYDAKKDGILRMIDTIHGKMEDVVVFGDDVNDIVMFDPRWFSIAMGNASEELKKHANYITDTNINDGIWKACKEFKWI